MPIYTGTGATVIPGGPPGSQPAPGTPTPVRPGNDQRVTNGPTPDPSNPYSQYIPPGYPYPVTNQQQLDELLAQRYVGPDSELYDAWGRHLGPNGEPLNVGAGEDYRTIKVTYAPNGTATITNSKTGTQVVASAAPGSPVAKTVESGGGKVGGPVAVGPGEQAVDGGVVGGGGAGGGPLQLPGYEDRKNVIKKQLDLALDPGRTVPKMEGATIAPFQQAGSAQIAPAAQTTVPTLGAALTANAPRLGQAAQAGGVNIRAGQAQASLVGPAAQAADSDFRGDQRSLVDALGRTMRGEDSIAAIQSKRMLETEQNRQMGLAQTARPGQAAMAQRTAAGNMGRIGTEMVGRTLEAQLAERKAATDALGSVVGQARGQDLSRETFNAGETNTNQRLNANLGTSTSVANAGNTTSASIAAGQVAGQIGIANAASKNDIMKTQGGMDLSTALANQAAGNTRDTDRARIEADVGMANTGQANTVAGHQADLTQQGRQFDVGADNTRQTTNAGLLQDTNKTNLAAQLQSRGMDDQSISTLLNLDLENAGGQQHGAETAAELKVRQDMQKKALASAWAIAKLQEPKDRGWFYDLVSAAGPAVATVASFI